MPRYGLVLEYFGPSFQGWQRQAKGPSVQESVETAITAFSGEEVRISAAGRTDSGVHATAQVAHLDLTKDHSAHTVRSALNFYLKDQGVVVIQAWKAHPDFHARFSAIGRQYLYRILIRPSYPILEQKRVWWHPRKLDITAMQDAAQRLLGKHDFTSFRATHCQAKSPIKTLDLFDIQVRDDEIRCQIESRSFLHHQVRNMMGTLALVGEGRWQPEDIDRALAARKRSAAGPTAPAVGLYLTGVVYPPELMPPEIILDCDL